MKFKREGDNKYILLNGFGDNTGGYFSCFEPIIPSPVKIRGTSKMHSRIQMRYLLYELSSVETSELYKDWNDTSIRPAV